MLKQAAANLQCLLGFPCFCAFVDQNPSLRCVLAIPAGGEPRCYHLNV